MNCHLQRFVGTEEPCAREACPFWESSKTAGHCGIEHLALGVADADVAGYLLELRDELMSGHAVDEDAAHAAFARRLGRDV